MCKIVNTNGKFCLEDNGTQVELSMRHFYEKKTGKTWYYLPENSANCKLLADKNLYDGYELGTRAPRTTGTQAAKVSNTNWYEYLSEEDKQVFDALKAKALKAKQIADIQAQIKAMTEQLANMGAGE